MPAEPSAKTPDLGRALRQTAVTALLTLILLLPLIGFNTIQNIRNELVLETRWPLLFVMVAIVTQVFPLASETYGSVTKRVCAASRNMKYSLEL